MVARSNDRCAIKECNIKAEHTHSHRNGDPVEADRG